jgi:hypothetical protein
LAVNLAEEQVFYFIFFDGILRIYI